MLNFFQVSNDLFSVNFCLGVTGGKNKWPKNESVHDQPAYVHVVIYFQDKNMGYFH